MKTRILFLVIAITASQAMDMSKRVETLKDLEEAKAKCMALLHCTEREWKLVESALVPDTKREKCLYRCIMERLRAFQNGQFLENEVSRLADAWYDKDLDGFNVGMGIFKKCRKSVDQTELKDKCEVAGEMMTCLNKEFRLHWEKKNNYDLVR